jgi:hypothetical protein
MLAPLKTAEGLKIDGIFACNESTTFGMLRCLQDAGLAGKVLRGMLCLNRLSAHQQKYQEAGSAAQHLFY